jgi:arylsulfatase A-like enzyme
MKKFVLLIILLFVSRMIGCATKVVDRPNILWITAEDMSATLGCYGDKYAITPNIDGLAKQSVKYTNAFASAPVCSPSRACLINGVFATTQGAHPMRGYLKIPKYMNGFPSLMRKAGYYTTNNVKTDYNSGSAKRIIKASWNESSDKAHWRNGKKGKPFFSIFNLMTSHQSRAMVWPYDKFKTDVQSKLSPDEIHDPAKAPLPPYYPDTPVIRRTVARNYDCVTAMDKEVGAILKQLEDDGLAENTIVFFYSDHGTGLPRHKRALFDSGMHVPMLIRFPEKYKHLAPGNVGSTTDRLVSFVDFGPSVLSLVGVDIPDWMEGKPFLGPKNTAQRKYVYGYRDRCDEALDMARSVRDKRYLYIRNYMPHLGYNQQTAWPDQGEVRHEFYRLAKKESMTPAQWQFAGPTRPVEELYDCKSDPNNLTNLADSSSHQQTLERLRRAHIEWVTSSRDLGFVPEIELFRIAEKTLPYEWARKDGAYDQKAIILAASRVGGSDVGTMMKNLGSENISVRYWGATALAAAKTIPDSAKAKLKGLLNDESIVVRIEAANALARHGDAAAGLATLKQLLKSDDTTVLLHAARTVELLGDPSAKSDMQALFKRYEEDPADPAWFIRFATTGYLNRLK